MTCPRCGAKMNVQVTNIQSLKVKHSKFYWIVIGWWLNPILWLCFTLPMLIVHLFKPKNYKLNNQVDSIAVCTECGYIKNLGGK